MTVDIFIPCFIDQVYPETGFNMIKVLERAGVKVRYNENQSCCGQMAFNSGFWEKAKSVGEKFIDDFDTDNIVVGPTASCIGYVKNYYDKLFTNTSYHLKFKSLQSRIYELTDFLVNKIKYVDFGAEFNHKVTYHDSCAALREYGLKNESRILLSKVKGLTLIDMKDRDVCCGFGGTFSVKHPSIASAMAEQKVENALETGAEYIISADSSCLMHQQGYINKAGHNLKTIHIADVLASGW